MFSINFTARTVTIDGEKANLTPKEYDLLFYLVRNKNNEIFHTDKEQEKCHRDELGKYVLISKSFVYFGNKAETNTIDKKYFDRDRKDINYKEYKAYRKLLKRDIKEDNYNIREFSDCFYCINKYFDFYLSNIFGYCNYLPETIDSIIDYDYNFSKYTVNPIQYMKNIILFKKFISKQQDGEYFNLMKLGFIFYKINRN